MEIHNTRAGTLVATLLIGSALGLVGCSSAPPAPPLPAGHYSNPSTPHGAETLDVTGQGGYTQTVAGVHHIQGTFAPAPNGITFTENAGGLCAGQAGTYSVTTDANGTHFAMVTDPCSVRAQDFPSGTWTR